MINHRYLLVFGFVVVFALNATQTFAQETTATPPAVAPPINRSFTSVNINDRVLFLIFHFTAGGMASSFETLMGKGERQVSSHFLINDQPSSLFPDYIYNIVPEEKRAWHAGISDWGIHSSLNSPSIGVEIVNLNGNEYPYPPEQVKQIIALGKYLVDKYQIAPDMVLGHSDIAPPRKDDPGTMFPWEELYKNGVGAWPDDNTIQALKAQIKEVPNVAVYQKDLSIYGYKVPSAGMLDSETINVIKAFQRHFRPNLVNGIMDLESYIILRALNKKYKKV